MQTGNLEILRSLRNQEKAIKARTAEKLAKAHPDSESIKHGFTIAITA